MHNRLVLNNTNMAYRAASLSVFPNLPWLAWFKRIVCPLTRTMIATGLLCESSMAAMAHRGPDERVPSHVCAVRMAALGSLVLVRSWASKPEPGPGAGAIPHEGKTCVTPTPFAQRLSTGPM